MLNKWLPKIFFPVVWLYILCVPCVCLVISNIYFFSFHISALIASSVSVVLFHEVRQVWQWQTYQVMCVPASNPANLLSWQFWSLEGLYCKYWSVMLFTFGHILNYKYKLMKKTVIVPKPNHYLSICDTAGMCFVQQLVAHAKWWVFGLGC